MKSRKLVLFVLLSVMLLSGVSVAAGEDVKIGFSMALRDQFLSAMEAGFNKAAEAKGIEYTTVDAQQNANTQISQVQQFASQGYSAIIVNLVSTDTTEAIIDAAGDVPLVFVNRAPGVELIKGKQTYVGSDENQSGGFQGQVLAEFFKAKGVTEINYVLFQGTLGLQHTTLRTESPKKILEDAGFKLNKVYEDTADFDRAKAQNKMQQFLSTNKKFDCVIANNDEMALGVIEAMKDAGIDLTEIPVVGIDATPAGLSSMDAGELYATVFQDADGQGGGALDAALKLINGEDIDVKIDIPFQLVTKDNYKEYMK